ncbi:DUF4034 domain-containing protein [Intestinirhabdus alba]|jgi:hypothetical protein|uniref:DUF4034 domain-containing protein n=1 Tax=Intestinirhabdus alba TaxID=2899544 RepID=A0A6L6IRJ4_9ENTR|nr:DUF4034 domain-containing protein [Intestinirhabdus alba]MTH48338.1 DUF4034 domain-containing protein [Intestinirhabdus alba]
MLFRKLIACTFLIIPYIACADSNTETLERIAIQQQTLSWMHGGEWAKLEAMIAAYNNDFPATSGGTHKLVVVWASIVDTFSGVAPESGIGLVAKKWLAASPGSTCARMLQALEFNARATRLRGEGPASGVDPSIWPEYKQLMQQEKAFLLKNKDIADKDAAWYQEMEIVARNLGDKALLYHTLEEGSKKYPAYQNIYLQAMEARLPKWGGSAEEVEKIARLAAENNKARSGMANYAYIWFNAISFQPEMASLLRENKIVSWNDMLQGWHDRYKQYPSTRTLNNLLISACIAQDKNAFTEADKQIQGQVEPQIWPRGLSYQKCKTLMKKLASPENTPL